MFTMICPSCAELMGHELRVIGSNSDWWVCPECGVRIEYESEEPYCEFSEYIHQMNLTGGFHEMNK